MNRRDRRKRLDEIASVSDALRADIDDAPDFTGQILNRVHDERPFLDRTSRRWVIGSRLMACGAVVFCGMFVVAVNRWAPDAVDVAQTPQPVTAVVTGLSSTGTQLNVVPRTIESMLVANTPELASTPLADLESCDESGNRDSAAAATTARVNARLGSGAGDLTVRCFVGPMYEPRCEVRTAASPTGRLPPITLARASAPELPVARLATGTPGNDWFEPVHLRPAVFVATRNTGLDRRPDTRSTPPGTFSCDLLAPR